VWEAQQRVSFGMVRLSVHSATIPVHVVSPSVQSTGKAYTYPLLSPICVQHASL
jgi:hypothetical protein